MIHRYNFKDNFSTTHIGSSGILRGERVGNGKKIQHLADFDENIDDRDIVDFCLNCTKPNCVYGNCKEFDEFMKNRKNGNG